MKKTISLIAVICVAASIASGGGWFRWGGGGSHTDTNNGPTQTR